MQVRPDGEKHRILRNHFLFRDLGEAELDAVIAQARVVHFKTDEQIFLKGSPGNGMMAVLKGDVRISVPGLDGREIVLTVIGQGDILGEIALIDGKERTADAVAATDCQLLIIERRNFLPFLEHQPKIATRLLVALCERLRRTTEQVEDLALRNLPERLAKKLLALAAERGKQTPEGVQLGGRLTQGEIANMLATSRESVNKQLSRWQREGILQSGPSGSLIIRDLVALRAIVQIE